LLLAATVCTACVHQQHSIHLQSRTMSGKYFACIPHNPWVD